MMSRYRCVTQLDHDTWEIQLAKPTDPRSIDDLCNISDVREELAKMALSSTVREHLYAYLDGRGEEW